MDATEQSSAKAAVGALFRSAREAQGLSQAQVAYLTNDSQGQISRTTISDIERGVSFPNLEVLVSLSKVLHMEPVEAIERVELAMAPPVDLTDAPLEALRMRAEVLFWAGDYRTALAVYDAMYQRLVLDPPADSDEARCLTAKVEIDRSVTLRQCSALQASEAAAKRALELAKGVPQIQSNALMVLASLFSHQESLELAEITARQAITLAEGVGARLQGQAWNQLGNVLTRAGRFDEARTAFLEARKLAIQEHDHHLLLKAEGNIGSCLLALGQAGPAKKHFRVAVELARKHDDPAGEAFWLIELGRVAMAEGAVDEADRCASAALRIARPTDRVLTIFRAEWLRHQVVRRRSPESDDRQRIAYLKKLYARVQEHRGIDVINEFRTSVLDADGVHKESPRD